MKTLQSEIKTMLRNYYKTIKGKSWPIIGKYYQKNYSLSEVEERFSKTRLFFILGAGRSGTSFLSNLLNRTGNASVFHEPDFAFDVEALPKSKDSGPFSRYYLDAFRKYSIYRRIVAANASCYGEVTGTLRYHASELKQVFPNLKILMIVRDGRDFIRSAWRFKFYQKTSAGTYALKPGKGERYYAKWHQMSRFEKYCWMWMDTYEYLLQHIPEENIVRFEDILKDYRYFSDKILRPLKLEMDEEKWKMNIGIKSENASKSYQMFHWTKWNEKAINDFHAICGKTMQRLGYPMNQEKN